MSYLTEEGVIFYAPGAPLSPGLDTGGSGDGFGIGGHGRFDSGDISIHLPSLRFYAIKNPASLCGVVYLM